MRDSIHKYFKVGTIQWMSHPRRDTIESVRAFCSDDYFDALELKEFTSDAVRAEAKRLVSQSHMEVCYCANPTLLRRTDLNPNSLDETVRMNTEAVLLKSVDEAVDLGSAGIAIMAGKWESGHREEAYSQLLKTTCNVCRYAMQKGVFVEMEVFDYDVEKAALIGPAPLAARFAADVRSCCPNFGLLADLSHFPTTYENSYDVIRTLRPYITHFHIGNAVMKPGCAAYGDQHPRFGFPNGSNDTDELLEFLRVLRQEGFFRPEAPLVLSFEVKPFGDEDEDIVLANAKRVLNRAWALLED